MSKSTILGNLNVFCHRFLTLDETRIHQFSPVGVHQSDTEVLRRGNAQQSASSVLHCISWDARSVIFIYYPEKRKSDNKILLYCVIRSFEQRNEEENVKCGKEKMFHKENAQAHTSINGMEKLNELNYYSIHLYSLALSLSDYYLLPIMQKPIYRVYQK